MPRCCGSAARTCRCPMRPILKSSRCPPLPKSSKPPRRFATDEAIETGSSFGNTQNAARPKRGVEPGTIFGRTADPAIEGILMPINILMPALSPTMEKGNLAKWHKKEGEAVKTGDVIAEIETDKATMEYEAVDDGVMAKIVVPEGTNDVPVNALIAVLAQEGEDAKAAAATAGKGATPSARAPSTPPSPPRGEGAAQQAA